jgi:hypothetical protein
MDGDLVQRRSHARALLGLVFKLADGAGGGAAAGNSGRLALTQESDAAQHFVAGFGKIARRNAGELVQELLNIGAIEEFLVQVFSD